MMGKLFFSFLPTIKTSNPNSTSVLAVLSTLWSVAKSLITDIIAFFNLFNMDICCEVIDFIKISYLKF